MKLFQSEKKCCGCKHTGRHFRANKHHSDGLQSYCIECDKANQAAWYIKNNEAVRHRTKERKDRLRSQYRQAIYDYLKAYPCVDCGEADPVVLHFDHVRGIKSDNLCSMINAAKPWDLILAEIEKCEIRCANCHMRRTAQQFGWQKWFLSQDEE